MEMSTQNADITNGAFCEKHVAIVYIQQTQLICQTFRSDEERKMQNWISVGRKDSDQPGMPLYSDWQARIQNVGQGGPEEFLPQGGPEPNICSKYGSFP